MIMQDRAKRAMFYHDLGKDVKINHDLGKHRVTSIAGVIVFTFGKVRLLYSFWL